MKTIQIDGKPFYGPYVLGKDSIPNNPAIALVCTEAGEGMKIMSVLHGDKIADVIANSPKNDCWKKKADHGIIDVYIFENDMPEAEREKFRLNAISKRIKFIFCDELPKIEDDW